MIKDSGRSRRLFLRQFFSMSIGLAAGALMTQACRSKTGETGKDDACDDSGLGADDLKARERLGYTKQASSKNKQCGGCKLWLPLTAAKTCGKCQLFKGPVPATAVCAYWAPME